ncbi:MAG: hypothetical protein CMB99_00755 [Flavobacteriaceae bacterium]|nr:hypothetical protein [Flavobacteriaceae bacterium]|tara:strand:- start:1943 stop:2683 length:741 start_codon:yes stop_codon:yes gene_type:complete
MSGVDRFLQPFQVGLGEYLGRFHASIVPLTKQVEEFANRPQTQAMAFASGRMVDDAQKMVDQYRSDTGNGKTPGTRLPAIIVAMDPEVVPTGRDFVNQVSTDQYVRFSESDTRVFKLRTMAIDQRVQVAIAAHEPATAKAIAAQLLLFMDADRYIYPQYEFAGHTRRWRAMIETPESPASRVDTEEANLTLLAIDLVLKATIPIYTAPAPGEPNDGSSLTPPGYPVVNEVIDVDKIPVIEDPSQYV